MARGDGSDQGKRLRLAREQRFPDAKAAATFHGWNYSTYSQHERGERGLTLDAAERYARAFRTSAGYLLTGESGAPGFVSVVGVVGAGPGGSIVFEDAGTLGEVAIPPGATPSSVAVEVRGDSMRGTASDGWLVFYEDVRDPPTEDLIGELCVVGLDDGRTLIKSIFPGRKRKHFDLESTNAETMRDVRLSWAAPVVSIVPRSQARRVRR